MFFQKMTGKRQKQYKKWIGVLLLITMLVGIGLTGCGGDAQQSSQQGAQPSQQTAQQQQSPQDTGAATQQQAQQSQKPATQNPSADNKGNESSAQNVSQQDNNQSAAKPEQAPQKTTIKKNGEYTAMQDVADYLHEYGKLPSNFITKNKAKDLGWDSEKGNLGKVAPGKSIGGDTFGNREGLLPKKDGRKYYECDINYDGGYRGAERIIYSNDGLIYYTNDHYKTFTQLY